METPATKVVPQPATSLLTLEFSPTESEFLEACLTPNKSRRLRNNVFVCIAGSLLALSELTKHDISISQVGVGVVVVISALASPHLFRNSIRKQFENNPVYNHPSILTIASEGLLTQSNFSDNFYRWHFFTHVTQTKNLLLLHGQASQIIYIPKRLFPTQPEFDQCHQLLIDLVGRTKPQTDRAFPVTPVIHDNSQS